MCFFYSLVPSSLYFSLIFTYTLIPILAHTKVRQATFVAKIFKKNSNLSSTTSEQYRNVKNNVRKIVTRKDFILHVLLVVPCVSDFFEICNRCKSIVLVKTFAAAAGVAVFSGPSFLS